MINKMIFCLLIFAIPINGECQSRLFSNDKTQHIIDKIQVDSLCIIQPSILWAKIDGEDVKALNRFLFDANIHSFAENDSIERNLLIHCDKEFDNYFNDTPHYFSSFMSSHDSGIINAEMKKMEKIVKDEKIEIIFMSDTLANILSKFPARQYLLTDIIEYRYVTSIKLKPIFIKINCFLIDSNSRQVEFYDYRIWIHRQHHFRQVFKGSS